MPRKSDKRERLVQAAKKLMFQQGFNITTLADIAQEADVPLGNVYYYFKTKESIGDAVIEFCLNELSTRLTNCDTEANPTDRLCKYVDQEVEDADWTLMYGDRIGALAQELSKSGSQQLASACANLMQQSVNWLKQQFANLGNNDEQALRKARELMALLQGVNLLSMTFKDRENHRELCQWVKTRLRGSSSSDTTYAEEDVSVEAYA